MIGFSTQRIDTVLGAINVHLSGSGPAMVCWPSLLMNARMWDAQAEHFGSRYRMVLIDPPGHGGSDALKQNFTMEDCAFCLTQVLDALAIRDCVLVGNSWGGMMGGVFAALYPERTRAAVLMNCSASAVGLSQKLEFLAMTFILRRCQRFPRFMVQRAVAAFAGDTTERTRPGVMAFIRATIEAVNPKSVHWAINSVVTDRIDQHAQMAKIRVPVLVLTGDEDRTFPVVETQMMANAIANSQFVVVPCVGHLVALEAPDVVNDIIDKFLVGIAA